MVIPPLTNAGWAVKEIRYLCVNWIAFNTEPNEEETKNTNHQSGIAFGDCYLPVLCAMAIGKSVDFTIAGYGSGTIR